MTALSTTCHLLEVGSEESRKVSMTVLTTELQNKLETEDYLGIRT